jgi:hypothetical protein
MSSEDNQEITLAQAVALGLTRSPLSTLRNRMYRDRAHRRFAPPQVGEDRATTSKLYRRSDIVKWLDSWDGRGQVLPGMEESVGSRASATRRGSRDVLNFLDYLALFGVHLARLDEDGTVKVVSRDERSQLVSAWRYRQAKLENQAASSVHDTLPVKQVDGLASLLNKIKEK